MKSVSENVKSIVYPILTEMASRLELELIAYGEERLNKHELFEFPNLEQKGFILGDIYLSLQAIRPNVDPKFELRPFYIKKSNDAKWSDFLTELNRATLLFKPVQKTTEHEDIKSATIYKDKYGNFSRPIAGKKLIVKSNPKSKKGKLLDLLCNSADSISTEDLVRIFNFPTPSASRKAVGEINFAFRTKLQLDKGIKLIIHEQGNGYRINPVLKIENI